MRHRPGRQRAWRRSQPPQRRRQHHRLRTRTGNSSGAQPATPCSAVYDSDGSAQSNGNAGYPGNRPDDAEGSGHGTSNGGRGETGHGGNASHGSSAGRDWPDLGRQRPRQRRRSQPSQNQQRWAAPATAQAGSQLPWQTAPHSQSQAGGPPGPGAAIAGMRLIFVHGVGNKRELIPNECCLPDYVSVPDKRRAAVAASSGPFRRSTTTRRFLGRACPNG
jgi:hypothetical protein